MSKSGAVALYARVSSERQARDHTIDSQVAALKERIAARRLPARPDNRYVDDVCSGTHIQRLALEKLSDAVAGGHIERIYVHAPDRLARKHVHQLLLIEDFAAPGPGDIPEPHVRRHGRGQPVAAGSGHYRRVRTRQETRAGSARSPARCALWRGQRVDGRAVRPIVTSPALKVGEWPFRSLRDEADIVRCIFAWIGRDRLASACARCAGVCSPGAVEVRAGLRHWGITTIRGLLANPAYIGRAVLGAVARCAGRTAAALDPTQFAAGAERHAARRGCARGMDRDSGAGLGRSCHVRSGAGTARRESPAQAPKPRWPALAAAGADGLPLLRLCLLRQDFGALAYRSLEGYAPLLPLHRCGRAPAQRRDQVQQSNRARRPARADGVGSGETAVGGAEPRGA